MFKSFNFWPEITELINSDGTGTQTQVCYGNVSALHEVLIVELGSKGMYAHPSLQVYGDLRQQGW